MSKGYAGDPANFPTTVPIPDPVDERDALAVAVPLEGLADRTAHLAALPHVVEVASFKLDDPTSAHAQIGDTFVRGYRTDGGIVATIANGLRAGDTVEIHAKFRARIDVPAGAAGGSHRGFLSFRVGDAPIDNEIPEIAIDFPAWRRRSRSRRR